MRKNHGWAAFWQKKQYIIAGTLVILAAVGMTVLYSRGQEQERKQLEQEIAAEMDTENQNVAMEEETEADQVASILKPQTQSTETAEVEKESEEADSGQEEVAPTGNTSQALHFAANGFLTPIPKLSVLVFLPIHKTLPPRLIIARFTPFSSRKSLILSAI